MTQPATGVMFPLTRSATMLLDTVITPPTAPFCSMVQVTSTALPTQEAGQGHHEGRDP